MICIILNSLTLGMVDYSCVNADGDPDSKWAGQLENDGLRLCTSWRNEMIVAIDPFFLAVFTFECVLKVVRTNFGLG
jgi:hypothetical protein